jgi:NAD(P)H-hydrate epimerase
MKVVTARQMQTIDKKATQMYKIPAIILMENAAIVSAFIAMQMLNSRRNKILLFCGQGNNGGDGFACARHLINRGFKVKVYFLGNKRKLSREASINYQILCKISGHVSSPSKLTGLQEELRKVDLIIDALLGIGLKDIVRQPYFEIIKLINESQKPVLSLDIPSGLEATYGRVCGIAVKAQRTVTFGLPKRGLLYSRAKAYTGQLTIGDISLPRKLIFDK